MKTPRIGITGGGLAILFALATRLALGADSTANQFLPAVPEGCYLQEYDDCGVEGRQPHIVMKDCYLWTFATSDTDAGPKERSAVFSYKSIRAVYGQLDPQSSYVLALTYASDHVYHRVQSLEANGIVLHGPYALPNGKATRVIVKVPPAVVGAPAQRVGGKMTLAWKIHGEVNATVSIIELWSNKRGSREQLRFASITGLPDGLQGQVLDLAYDPVVGATVRVNSGGKSNAPLTTSGAEGIFTFSRKNIEPFAADGRLSFVADHHGRTGRASVSAANVFFKPVHYRPLPDKTAGLGQNCLLLDGMWAITTNALLLPLRPSRGPRSLATSDWAPIRVPGQWLQQGFDVPKDKPVAMAREFVIPKAWAGDRIILRFDASPRRHALLAQRPRIGLQREPLHTGRMGHHRRRATRPDQPARAGDEGGHRLGGAVVHVRLCVSQPGRHRPLGAGLRVAADARARVARERGPPSENGDISDSCEAPSGPFRRIRDVPFRTAR